VQTWGEQVSSRCFANFDFGNQAFVPSPITDLTTT
jgi:hypothetical protein